MTIISAVDRFTTDPFEKIFQNLRAIHFVESRTLNFDNDIDVDEELIIDIEVQGLVIKCLEAGLSL